MNMGTVNAGGQNTVKSGRQDGQENDTYICLYWHVCSRSCGFVPDFHTNADRNAADTSDFRGRFMRSSARMAAFAGKYSGLGHARGGRCTCVCKFQRGFSCSCRVYGRLYLGIFLYGGALRNRIGNEK